MLELFHVVAELDGDGDVFIKQIDHSGNEAVIVMNPSQLRQIANHVGVIKTDNDELLDAVWKLTTDAQAFIEPCWLDEIVERVGEGLAFSIAMNNLRNDIERIARMLGLDPSEYDGHRSPEVTEKEISVTPAKVGAGGTAHKKRGRPPKEDALTGAERQARYRERQRDLLAPEATP